MSSDSEFEPTPPKQRRLIKPRMISSDESGSPVVRSLRNGRFNKIASDEEDVCVLSDIEISASPESGSPNFGPQSNSERPLSATPDTSVDNQFSKVSKRSSESRKNTEKDGVASSSTGVDSDSNDSQSEKCPICWLTFTNQEVATPSTCDHRFCFHCLMEWSKTTNTCPVDRQTFNDINVRPKFASKVTRLVPVETRVITDTDIDGDERELDTDEDDFYTYDSEGDVEPLSEEEFHRVSNQSSVELDTIYSTEEGADENSICVSSELSSSNENDLEENLNSVVVVTSSSEEEEVYSPSSEYNELSSSSSATTPESFSSSLPTSLSSSLTSSLTSFPTFSPISLPVSSPSSSPTSRSSFCSVYSSSTSSS